ncbi:hypothetical protein Peur_033395 [Populus x canadensis]
MHGWLQFENRQHLSQKLQADRRGPESPLADPSPSLSMSTTYIASAIVGSFAIAYVCDHLVSDKKIFGGTTPRTVSNKEWWEETDRKFQAWPRTGGPPVVMNPITRQNFIVKSQDS